MISRDEIINFTDEYLNSREISDISRNGLQIEGKKHIKKIAFGVSASLECMKKAAEGGADMLITHHGLLWGHEAPFTGTLKKKLEFMFSADMNLCAWHLPLDMHPECGNNAQLMKMIGAEIGSPFGRFKGNYAGFSGTFTSPVNIDDIIFLLKQRLDSQPFCFRFGRNEIRTVAIVSGGAAGSFSEAIEKGLDLYITGEPSEQSQELARETGSNFIAAGHYNTEKPGVQALSEVIRGKFGVETFFADVPNPV